MISLDDEENSARQFLKDRGLPTVGMFHDADKSFSKSLRIRALPASVVIAPGKGIVGRVQGYLEWNDPSVIRALKLRQRTSGQSGGPRR
jgi:hypothetical protein